MDALSRPCSSCPAVIDAFEVARAGALPEAEPPAFLAAFEQALAIAAKHRLRGIPSTEDAPAEARVCGLA